MAGGVAATGGCAVDRELCLIIKRRIKKRTVATAVPIIVQIIGQVKSCIALVRAVFTMVKPVRLIDVLNHGRIN